MMNKIIESFLKAHIKEYSIESYEINEAFEHFCNRIIINQHTVDRFDPKDTMTKKGEIGIDGIAIMINDKFVDTLEVAQDLISNSKEFKVNFVFVQSKTSSNFDGGEISTFVYGVRSFFGVEGEIQYMNEEIDRLIRIKDYIYENSINFTSNPDLNLYYVCCGKWEKGNNLGIRVKADLNSLRKSENFSDVRFNPCDNEYIINSYKELKKKVKKSFSMEKNISFPKIKGVHQAFMGLVKCKDYVDLLKDSKGNIMRNIFEDNVRDFQGYNLVNNEIKSTLENSEQQDAFVVLNNGITIVAKTITRTGDVFHIHNYQIVNGCQTSYVLFDNYDILDDNTYVSLKIIETSTNELSDKIIFTTNRQTEVKSEAFESTKKFHKILEDYYNSVEFENRLYYERRSKQYELEDEVNKTKVITLATQISAFVSMFLNEPHSTHRYYGEILKAYSGRLFQEKDKPEPYYISAYFIYKVEKLIKDNKLSKKYRPFKYHIICTMKTLIAGRKLMKMNSREVIKVCQKLEKVIKNEDKFIEYINKAKECIDIVLKNQDNEGNLNRTKDVTNKILDYAIENWGIKEDGKYLKRGSIVLCTVKNVNDSFVYVVINDVDIRNYGAIHISKVNGKYIEDLSTEVFIGEKLKARIINEDFNNEFGWELSCI